MTPLGAAKLIGMLCAKTAHLEPVISTFGALCRDDVSMALALVKNLPATMLVRIKYADDVSNVATFEDELVASIERGMLRHVEQFGAPQRWRAPRPGFLRDMCRLALAECLSPNLCWNCGGRMGALVPPGKWVECIECAGTGHKRLQDAKRIELLGVNMYIWRKTWKVRYRVIQGQLDKYEDVALGGMAKRLSV